MLFSHDQSIEQDITSKWPKIAARAAVIASLVMFLLKLAAHFLSNSPAILASMLDSLSDILISGISLFAVIYASRPADEYHRFGHGKMEGVAALFQSALVIGAGIFVVIEALGRFGQTPESVHIKLISALMMVATLFITIGVVLFQKWVVRRTQSLAIKANSAHYTADICTTVAVISALILQKMGGPVWVDPLIAIAIALWLIKTAYDIGCESLHMLLDRELPEEERAWMRTHIRHYPGVMGVHDLRTRRSGNRVLIYFDIEVDPEISVKKAHNIASAVEASLLKKYPAAEIMIHVDPLGEIADSRHPEIEAHHLS